MASKITVFSIISFKFCYKKCNNQEIKVFGWRKSGAFLPYLCDFFSIKSRYAKHSRYDNKQVSLKAASFKSLSLFQQWLWWNSYVITLSVLILSRYLESESSQRVTILLTRYIIIIYRVSRGKTLCSNWLWNIKLLKKRSFHHLEMVK